MSDRPDRPILGIMMILFSGALWALHDAMSKVLADSFGTIEILFLRSAAALVMVTVFLLMMRGFKGFCTRRPWLNLLRGLLGCGSFGLFVMALPLQPLVNTFAVAASAPLIITILSVPLLREPVGVRRWVTVVGGFLVILFMLQPGSGVDPLATALLLTSNVFFGLGAILSRLISRLDDPAPMTFYNLLVFTLFGALLVPFDWVTPTASDWGMFIAVGVVAGVALYTMTIAFAVAAPSLVAPFEYTSIAWAALIGWIIWDDIPTVIVTVGSLGLVLCGLYLLHRERVAARRAHPVAADVFGHDGPASDKMN
ncbi:MAG: DMT family transporter [Pseudomonadota bacterium]|nr:DMT family transporter [Pseudomonadota bacterium]